MFITFEQLKKSLEALRDFVFRITPQYTSDLVNDSGFAIKDDIPRSTSDLVNDSGFITVDDIDIPEPADWNAEDGDPGYIENKPGIYSGDALGLRTDYGFAPGASAIALGTSSTSYFVYISGDANATKYTYSQQYAPSLPWYQMAMVETGKVRIRANGVTAYITAIDTTARTITVDSTLSASALSYRSASIIFSTTASGSSSIAIGSNDFSTGPKSFAYGSDNLASGNYSVASGIQTVSSGTQSSTKGKGTIANHKSQDASGEYNIEDSNVSANTERGTYVEIVGNGTADNARSNARTLDWSGNEWLSGTLKIGGAGYTDANAKEISTKEYVANASSALETSLKTYTDNALSALETSLKKYTDDTNDTLEASLKQYTDDALSTLETSLKQYTDNAISTLETSLKQYIDASISSSINTEDTALKQYVDDAIAKYVKTTANMSVTGTTLNILGQE